jgi:hypothetical protein
MKRPWLAGAVVGAIAMGSLWLVVGSLANRSSGQQPEEKRIAFDPRGTDLMLGHRIGEHCTVYFRRDRLGLAATKLTEILSADSRGLNNVSAYVTGKLARVNAAWVCLATDKMEYTIPTEVILMVEVQPK